VNRFLELIFWLLAAYVIGFIILIVAISLVR
jgi:hypothetical protein